MKKNILIIGIALGVACWTGSGNVRAQSPFQPYQPFQQRPSASSPAYSPYLNLTRPGNPAVNYFGLVRPQIDAANAIGTLQNQYGALNQAVNATPISQPTGLPTTGHAARFMDYSTFYPGLGRSAAPGVHSAAPAASRGAPPAQAALAAPAVTGR
jgi:hypothetical protein